MLTPAQTTAITTGKATVVVPVSDISQTLRGLVKSEK
jgi:hypothetical protein